MQNVKGHQLERGDVVVTARGDRTIKGVTTNGKGDVLGQYTDGSLFRFTISTDVTVR